MADKSISCEIETPSRTEAPNDWLAEADALAMKLKAVRAAKVEVLFAIGDWLNKYADRDSVYEVGEEKFQKPRKQLIDYASTARRMPESLRTFKLSYNHYRVVATLQNQTNFPIGLNMPVATVEIVRTYDSR